MNQKKRMQADEKVCLRRTLTERDRLLDGSDLLPVAMAEAIRAAPTSRPLMLTLDDLGELARSLAALCDRIREDPKARKTLDRIRKKVEDLLGHGSGKAPPAGDPTFRLVDRVGERLPDEGSSLLPMSSTTRMGKETYPLRLTETQREALIQGTRLRRALKNRIGKASPGTQNIEFTTEEFEELPGDIDFAVPFAPGGFKKRLIAVVEKLEDLLDNVLDEPGDPGFPPVKPTDRIYQLKVTLKDIKPPIWRRIQVPDCTLGDLHEILQVAFGWTHSHLHQFVVRGEYYGPIEPEGFRMEVEDEDGLLLSQIIEDRRKAQFVYEYDFGDGWMHEIQSERVVEREGKTHYFMKPRPLAV